MTKTNDDWKEAYFNMQLDVAAKLGCTPTPERINAAIRDLKRRAAVADQEFATRRAKIKDALRAALVSAGVSADKVDLVEDDLDQVARNVTGEL